MAAFTEMLQLMKAVRGVRPERRVDCPICEWPLRSSQKGLYCPFCGWREYPLIKGVRQL